MSDKDNVMKEREFLHDISNHLVVVQGMTSFISKSLASRSDVTEKESKRSEKAMNAIGKIMELVKERRAYLHSLSED